MFIKNIVLVFIMTLFVFSGVFAQKRNLEATKSEYAKFQLAYQLKKEEDQIKALKAAKQYLGEALVHKKTKDNPEVSTYQSLIHSLLVLVDKTSSEVQKYLETAISYYDKSKNLDTENKFSDLRESANQNIASYLNSKALTCYQKKEYDCALEYFKKTSERLPKDTTMIYYSGVVANLAGKKKESIELFKKIDEMGYNTAEFFLEYKKPYLELKDTVKALEIIERGRKLYPDDKNLLFDEINIYIAKEQADKIIEKIQEAIKRDPKNKTVHYVNGYSFESLEKYDEAFQSYRLAIEIDPKYYHALLAAGQVLIKQANLILNKANELPLDKEEQYEKLKAEHEVFLKSAYPYLERAKNLNQEERGIFTTLLEIYNKLKMTDDATRIKNEMEKLSAK